MSETETITKPFSMTVKAVKLTSYGIVDEETKKIRLIASIPTGLPKECPVTDGTFIFDDMKFNL